MINVINSTLPIIINEIIVNLKKLFWLEKSKLLKLYMLELTVFIIVKIPILKESLNDIPEIDNNDEIVINENMNIKIVKKYLFITL